MEIGLRDKVILVSGGASGIGEGITRACLAEGAQVIVASRSNDRVLKFVEEMKSTGAKCELATAELADSNACRTIVQAIHLRYGSIYAVVNNAGINDRVGLESGTPEAFMDSLRDNLLHYYALVHFALPALKASRGTVVNISSKVAVIGQGGTSAYAAAKGAQLALTREWAAELLPYGIRVNAVLPADVMTPLYKTWIDTFNNPQEKLQSITSRIPLEKRMTTSDEIAAAVVFLLSPIKSAHTTGQHIFVDGGYTHLDRSLT